MPLEEAGIARPITKPVRQAELQACVMEVLAKRRAAAPSPHAVRPQVRFSGRVLVAEDNGVNQLVARAMLHALGLECEIVSDGEAALRAWREGGHDLVLMDCQMPNVDGYEATRRIRREECGRGDRRRTPVITLTASVVSGVREIWDAAGMDDYLNKPYTEQALADVLSRWLPVREKAQGAGVPESRPA
jgi:CheY-like chemotaxis protein